MSNGNTTDLDPEMMRANITRIRNELSNRDDTYRGGAERIVLHQHDAGGMQIAWNDIQAVLVENKFIHARDGIGMRLRVPSQPTEGYNQHHHTSQFDGGVIAGVKGVHSHLDNNHGGFCFSVWAPGTTCPQIDWE